MRSTIRTALTAMVAAGLLAGAAGPVVGDSQDLASRLGEGLVYGVVRGDSSPITAARVYAYHLADRTFQRVLTDARGEFAFGELPAGLYQIIAHKTGFAPAVISLTRYAVEHSQFLEVELLPEAEEGAQQVESYWDIQQRIPGDVLREIEDLDALETASFAAPRGGLAAVPDRIATRISTGVGVDDLQSTGPATLTGGELDLQTQWGGLDVDLEGVYWHLASTADEVAGTGDGLQSRVALKFEGRDDTQVRLATRQNRLGGGNGETRPVDFRDYQLGFSRDFDARSSSAVGIQVTEQENFYRQAETDPAEIPEASRSVEVHGTYNRELTERSTLETGLRYRERQILRARDSLLRPTTERVDLFGRGGYRVLPTVLVEYGSFITMEDGSLSLYPQGGVVVQLNPRWQASGLFSQRIEGDPTLRPDLMPVYYGEGGSCELGEEHCYKLLFSRSVGDESLAFSAVHREFGETVRLFFDEDFFDQLESLFLVEGDQLPELQVSVVRRLSPSILTRIESSVAAGGGGVFYGQGNQPFENQVRFLKTSIDTRFQSTGSGLFVAFHHLQQDLSPLVGAGLGPVAELATDRLQVRVSQDLDALIDLPAEWAVHLNMEVSSSSTQDREDELRRRVLGGIAVKF